MKRSDAVLQGAPLVFDLEEAAMTAVRSAAVATVGFIDLRRESKMSATVGADAWEELFATTAHLHAGMRSSLAFHARMANVKAAMGCARIVLNGGGDKNPHDPSEVYFTEGATQSTDAEPISPLRLVS